MAVTWKTVQAANNADILDSLNKANTALGDSFANLGATFNNARERNIANQQRQIDKRTGNVALGVSQLNDLNTFGSDSQALIDSAGGDINGSALAEILTNQQTAIANQAASAADTLGQTNINNAFDANQENKIAESGAQRKLISQQIEASKARAIQDAVQTEIARNTFKLAQNKANREQANREAIVTARELLSQFTTTNKDGDNVFDADGFRKATGYLPGNAGNIVAQEHIDNTGITAASEARLKRDIAEQEQIDAIALQDNKALIDQRAAERDFETKQNQILITNFANQISEDAFSNSFFGGNKDRNAAITTINKYGDSGIPIEKVIAVANRHLQRSDLRIQPNFLGGTDKPFGFNVEFDHEGFNTEMQKIIDENKNKLAQDALAAANEKRNGTISRLRKSANAIRARNTRGN